MKTILHFKWSLGVTFVTLGAAWIIAGFDVAVLILILGVLEISLSFDNAVVNAGILQRMSVKWQNLFLGVGIIIAVFGMRLIFPLVIVSITAGIGPVEVVTKAIEGGSAEEPGTYANLLTAAHPDIAAFGGMFLLMLVLDFFFEDREVKWLAWLERPLAKIGKLDLLSVVVAGIVLVVASQTLAPNPGAVLMSGILGLVTYILVNGLGTIFEKSGEDEADDQAGVHGDLDAVERSGGNTAGLVGKAAFFLFLYLEVLDASFSFDGVIGAFAISNNVFVIAAGLGIGAFFIRSLTVLFVREGTLAEFRYLEHGAHWAIGALAVIMFLSIGIEVPEVITGLIGVVFIGAAFIHSMITNKREQRDTALEEQKERELQNA